MSDPDENATASTAATLHLLERTDPPGVRELALRVRELLDAPALVAADALGFALRPIYLHGAHPTFPSAIVAAEGLDGGSSTGLAGTTVVDREAFLATPVLLVAGTALSVAKILDDVGASPEGLAELGPAALPAAACVRAIARVVLRTALARPPAIDELPSVLAHHSAPPGASLFIARDAALNTFGIDAPLSGGLSWGMVAKLVRPRVPQPRIVYEVGEAGHLLFTVSVLAHGVLTVSVRLGEGASLEVAVNIDALFERYMRLLAVVRFAPVPRLRLWVDEVNVAGARGGVTSIDRLIGGQTIGGGVRGRQRSALFLRELLLLGASLEPEQRTRLSRRLERHALEV